MLIDEKTRRLRRRHTIGIILMIAFTVIMIQPLLIYADSSPWISDGIQNTPETEAPNVNGFEISTTANDNMAVAWVFELIVFIIFFIVKSAT